MLPLRLNFVPCITSSLFPSPLPCLREFPFVRSVPRLLQYRKIGAERLEGKGKNLARKLNSGVVCMEEEREQKKYSRNVAGSFMNGKDGSKRLEFFLLLTV